MPNVNRKLPDFFGDQTKLSGILDNAGSFGLFREAYQGLPGFGSQSNANDIIERLIAEGETEIPVISLESVRYGIFTLPLSFVDNGAIPNAASALGTIADPVLLKGETSGTISSNNTVANQILVVKGARLLICGVDPEAGADALADVLMLGALHLKTASGVTPQLERRIGMGGFSGTVFDVLAVADTNAATSKKHAGRGASGVPFRRIPATPMFLKSDTIEMIWGKQINTAGNITAYLQIQGYAFDWEQSTYRPALECPPRGRVANYFGHRRIRGPGDSINFL